MQQQRRCLLLVLSNLTVGVAGRTLLQGINIRLREGEFVGLLGPSGCGKTTLLRCVSGLSDPLGGDIHFRGEPVPEARRPCYRRRVVLVHQNPVLCDTSVVGNLRLPFTFKSLQSEPFPLKRAEELLGVFGISIQRLSQDALSLSVGQQQRVCLVRALLLQPEILLLDEPTSSLDEKARASVESTFVEEARGRKMSALLVTHDRSQARRICDRVVDLGPHIPEGVEYA